MKIILKFIIISFFLSFLLGKSVIASDFKTNYQVDYNLTHFQDSLTTNVQFKITITNLKSDVYVNKYAISFPKSFAISNLKSSDDHGEIIPLITSDDLNTKVEMEFSNPEIGKDSVNNFYLNFNQTNLFKVNGNVWEVALPVIDNKQDGNYQVVVTLPDNTDKKISIAKPKPTSISGNQIIWINPQTKTIYAVFGNSQIYDTELAYHLKNTEVYPVITEVAFPPDTLYQKIFFDSIKPIPVSVYQDEDGNYLAKYKLNPLESKTIILKGFIEVYSTPRNDLQPVIREQINSQKNYLVSQQKYWIVNNLEKINSLNSPRSVYDFVVNSLKYNYKKINNNNSRLGAERILESPDQAVCLEFSDLFVGVSREKGILSREIQGYGFSYDPQLQPLSLVSDVLHSWPEYYDEQANLWVPVDPTWENTSGIDYFTSFDLNHIVFAIHGKKPDYPVPAGMYKIGESKDISIKATTKTPKENIKLEVNDFNLPSKILDNKNYQGKFSVRNISNVYLREVAVEIKTDNIILKDNNIKINSLAPFESKEISFDYRAVDKNIKNRGIINLYVANKQLDSKSIEIIPYTYLIFIKVSGVILILILTFFTVKKLRK